MLFMLSYFIFIVHMLFEKFAEDYARLRPGYPDDLISSLIERLGISDSSLILDLACGTGKLSRDIKSRVNARVVGLDRSLILLRYNKDMPVARGVSESLPLKAQTFDAAVIGQAFHWFNFDRALSEILRVLKKGAGFAIVWYRRTATAESHKTKMDELVKLYNPDYRPKFMDYDWQAIIKEHGHFDNLNTFETTCTPDYSIDDYLRLQRSKSYVGDAMTAENIDLWYNRAARILGEVYPDSVVKEKMEYFYVSAFKT